MIKRKHNKKTEREIRRLVNWAVATFDKPKELKYFQFANRRDDVDSRTEIILRKYTDLRKNALPQLLKRYVGSQHVITREQQTNLLTMLDSEDRSDWYMALIIIQKIKRLY